MATDKKKGSGLLAQMKQDVQREMIQANIEQIYAKGKVTGKFNHPPEIEEQIEIMRENREEIPLLREKISSRLKREKEMAEAENQLSKDFTAMAEHPSQHPKLKAILEKVAELNLTLSSNRFNMHAQMDLINEEWKKWEIIALKDIRIRQDQLNHCWCELKYWRKKADHAKVSELESRYKILTSEFVSLIHDIRKKKEVDIPTWLLALMQYEMEFYTGVIPKITQMEGSIRGMGPVQAMEIAGLEKFQPPLLAATPAVPALMPPPLSQPEPTSSPFPSGPTAPAAFPPPQELGRRKVKALYDFTAQGIGELTMKAGDEFTMTADSGDGWLMVAGKGGQQGLIPANYVTNI